MKLQDTKSAFQEKFYGYYYERMNQIVHTQCYKKIKGYKNIFIIMIIISNL